MTNYLKDKKFYLSGAIEHCTSHENWRTEPCQVLKERFGISVFDPFADPKQLFGANLAAARDRKDCKEIAKIAKRFVRKDLGTLDKMDGLIAYLPYKVPTTGTHHEIINSNNAKKPTLLICPEGREYVPLWYFGFIPEEFMFGNWEDLYKYLDKVNKGKSKNDRWHLIYGIL